MAKKRTFAEEQAAKARADKRATTKPKLKQSAVVKPAKRTVAQERAAKAIADKRAADAKKGGSKSVGQHVGSAGQAAKERNRKWWEKHGPSGMSRLIKSMERKKK